MTKSSCIAHSPQQQLVMIREDYLSIADKNHCAAALLNIFEYWHNVKLADQEQARIENDIALAGGAAPVDEDLWVYKSIPDLQAELLGLFGETKVSTALKLLCEKGYLDNRNNPKYGWDRTLQYLFKVDVVQAAILSLPSRKNKASTNRKSKASNAVKITDASRKNNGAIPKTTTKTTTEKKQTRAYKPDLVFTTIARETFGITGKITDPSTRGRINKLCKIARTTFEDVFDTAPDDKVSNAIVEFYALKAKENSKKITVAETFGTSFRGFLENKAKAHAARKLLPLPIVKQDAPLAEGEEYINTADAIRDLNRLRGA